VAQSKILLDTNSYLRLAKSVHPLLFVPFGAEEHCLYVLRELDGEWARNPRLRTKFAWVSEAQYAENRRKPLTLSRTQRQDVEVFQGYLWDQVLREQLGASRLDCLALAHGAVLSIPVVTDDGDMRALGRDFAITTMPTLQLLALMRKCDHVTLVTVRQIAAFWAYEIDLPARFAADYRLLFCEDPPA
jgi:hypothetical protein